MRGDGVQVLVVGAGIAGLAAAGMLRDWVPRSRSPTVTRGHPRKAPGSTCRASRLEGDFAVASAVRPIDGLG